MATELTAALVRAMMPPRPREGHKGTFGHTLLVAGSRGFTGAARLCAEGALRSGTGLVTAAVPDRTLETLAASLMEAMTLPLPCNKAGQLTAGAAEPALDAAESRDAAGVGPGLSQCGDTCGFVAAFVRRCSVPLVIDADGLNCLRHDLGVLEGAPAPRVLTPHPGEMARLAGGSAKDVQADREGVATTFARTHGCVVVLKGAGTLVAAPDGRVWRNPTGNSGMATGGTGDVLTGLMAGVLAQLDGDDAAVNAACIAVYVHGLAGDLAAGRMGERGFLARDLANAIPEAWRYLEDLEHAHADRG